MSPERRWNWLYLAGLTRRVVISIAISAPVLLAVVPLFLVIWLVVMASRPLSARLVALRFRLGWEPRPVAGLGGSRQPRGPATSGGAARRAGTLVVNGRRRRALPQPAKAPVHPPDPSRPVVLNAEDFVRTLAAMERHGWSRGKVLAQLDMLGARWVWRRRPSAPLVVTVADGLGQQRKVEASEEIHLRYRGAPRLWDWLYPSLQIQAYLGEDGRLVGSVVRRPVVRM